MFYLMRSDGMPNMQNVVEILIKADNKASAVIKQVDSDVDNLAQTAKRAGTETQRHLSLKEVSSNLSTVSTRIAAVGAAGMGLVGVAGMIGLQLNKNIAAAGAVAGMTADKFGELEKVAREVGRTSMVSANEAAEAMYYLASAGYDSTQIMQSLDGVVKLAAGTFSDMALSSQLIVGTLSQFQMEATKAANVADIFAYAVTNSQATTQKLADSLKYAGPVANAFGISLEQTVATMMAFYNAGLSGEQAGTALRNILLRLATPTSSAAKLLNELGIELDEISPKTHSIEEIARRFAEANIEVDKLAAIVGTEAVSAMSILIQQSGDINKLTTALQDSAGAAAKLSKEMENTPYGRYQMAMNQLKELAYSAFPAVVEAVQVLAEPLMNLVNWFNNLDDRTKSTIVRFTAFASAGMLVVGVGGKITSSVLNTVDAFRKLLNLNIAGTLSTISKGFKTLGTRIANFASGASDSFGALATKIGVISASVGLLIYDITKAIELGKALYELHEIKKETAVIQRETSVSEATNKLLREIRSSDEAAMEELVKAARAIYESKMVSTMQEATLLAISTLESGKMGALLQTMPQLRTAAQKTLVEHKITINIEGFETEWNKAGEVLKELIQEDIYRRVGL